MAYRIAPLVLVAACAFDSSGQGSGGADDGVSSDGPTTAPTPTTTMTTSATNASMSDSAEATTQDASTTDPTTPTDATQGTETSGDPTSEPTTTTADPTRGDDTTTDPSEGDTEVLDEEVCDGLDNDGDGGIDEGSPSNAECGGCTFLEATAGPYWFAICTDTFMWDLARTRCADFGPGGDLAKIENMIDQTALVALVDEDHWIGIDDIQTDGLWFWVDGTMARAGGMVFGYDGWGEGQPDGGLAENCAELDPAQFGWADSPCNQSQPIVCRHDA